MNQATSTSPFEVHLPQPDRPKAERERLAFYRLLPGLLATHRGQYVAIHDEQVVDSGPDAAELAARAVRRFNADVYVGLVSEEAEPVCRVGGARDVVRWESLRRSATPGKVILCLAIVAACAIGRRGSAEGRFGAPTAESPVIPLAG